jgi:hypothetical protein
MTDHSILTALPGLLTMDSMMWAATTAMLWQVYSKDWKGKDIRRLLYIPVGLGMVAILSTALSLVDHALEWRNDQALATTGVIASLVFAMTVLLTYFYLVKSIPDQESRKGA